jgi:hypothetical protein
LSRPRGRVALDGQRWITCKPTVLRRLRQAALRRPRAHIGLYCARRSPIRGLPPSTTIAWRSPIRLIAAAAAAASCGLPARVHPSLSPRGPSRRLPPPLSLGFSAKGDRGETLARVRDLIQIEPPSSNERSYSVGLWGRIACVGEPTCGPDVSVRTLHMMSGLDGIPGFPDPRKSSSSRLTGYPSTMRWSTSTRWA